MLIKQQQEEPLGTLAGRGTVRNTRGGNMIIKVSEQSYIIGIVSITPRVDYCQGNDFDMYFNTLNDLHKPALDSIGYQDLLTCKAAGWVENNIAYGKTVAWVDYMTNYNKTYGTFDTPDAFMYLIRAVSKSFCLLISSFNFSSAVLWSSVFFVVSSIASPKPNHEDVNETISNIIPPIPVPVNASLNNFILRVAPLTALS